MPVTQTIATGRRTHQPLGARTGVCPHPDGGYVPVIEGEAGKHGRSVIVDTSQPRAQASVAERDARDLARLLPYIIDSLARSLVPRQALRVLEHTCEAYPDRHCERCLYDDATHRAATEAF